MNLLSRIQRILPDTKLLNPSHDEETALQKILKFNGAWRPYQAKVLTEIDHHITDKKLHVVAAPGAGKTVLGIEAIRRIGRNALILTPRTTIRDQWIETISNFFIGNPSESARIVSCEPTCISPITCLTYQNIFQILSDTTSRQQFIKAMQKSEIGTLVLDEAHHLTESWGDVALSLIQTLDLHVVSLTATPPYDYSNAAWKKFVAICGEIDVEISVPALIQVGNLCPHQDLIYATNPTAAERKKIATCRSKINQFVDETLASETFKHCLEESLIRVLQAETQTVTDIELGECCLQLANACEQALPTTSEMIYSSPPIDSHMRTSVLEKYLNFCASEGSKSPRQKKLLKSIQTKAKSLGCYKNSTFELTNPTEICRALALSESKLESIVNICAFECTVLKENARICVLCDLILDDQEPRLRQSGQDKLGVIPIIEELIPLFNAHHLRIAALTGRIIVLPRILLDRIDTQFDKNAPISAEFQAHVLLRDVDDNKRAWIIEQVTKCLDEGVLHGVVGTSGLLGEGWNSRSVNSLIIASNVGSSMLSNQMRGRALRHNPHEPDKAACIWHLCTLESSEYDRGSDLQQLKRRFDCFLGLHLTEDRIENGLQRIFPSHSIPSNDADLQTHNVSTFEIARDRNCLSDRWIRALGDNSRSELATRVELRHSDIKTIRLLGLSANTGWLKTILNTIIQGGRIARRGAEYTFLVCLYKITLSALKEAGQLSGLGNRLKIKIDPMARDSVVIIGGIRSDHSKLQKALLELFSFDVDTRYFIMDKCGRNTGFVRVPETLSKNRATAEIFHHHWQKRVTKNCELIYARNQKNSRHLIQAKVARTPTLQTSQIWAYD